MKTQSKKLVVAQSGPEFEILTITPEKAAELLAKNKHNRSINPRSVQRLAMTMSAGEWQFNAQPIQIGKDGTLLDGQHRLQACVQSGVPIESLLVWNAEPSSQETMDMGKARSIADILKLRGFANANSVAAVGRRIALSKKYGFRAGAVHSKGEVNPGMVVSVVEDLNEIDRYTTYARQIAHKCNFTTAQIGFLMWWFDSIDREDSDFFWEKLRTGQGIYEGTAIYALRSLALLRETSGIGTNAHQLHTAGLIVKAWNKFRRGEQVQRLNFRPGGANPEEFPQPI